MQGSLRGIVWPSIIRRAIFPSPNLLILIADYLYTITLDWVWYSNLFDFIRFHTVCYRHTMSIVYLSFLNCSSFHIFFMYWRFKHNHNFASIIFRYFNNFVLCCYEIFIMFITLKNYVTKQDLLSMCLLLVNITNIIWQTEHWMTWA